MSQPPKVWRCDSTTVFSDSLNGSHRIFIRTRQDIVTGCPERVSRTAQKRGVFVLHWVRVGRWKTRMGPADKERACVKGPSLRVPTSPGKWLRSLETEASWVQIILTLLLVYHFLFIFPLTLIILKSPQTEDELSASDQTLRWAEKGHVAGDVRAVTKGLASVCLGGK